jgi:tetratricopeptide (TPR) repeat protein
MVVISAIGGTGGIGKTWLALTWANRNLHRFPDGQLFVDLHGFSPTGRPAHPADVLSGFLDALGVDRDRQPKDPDRRADLYRTLVANRQMLIVLDNAATTDQVTPLLPGGPHCTVLITSRNRLYGLVARHGAYPMYLDLLTDAEAHTLLTTALDPATTDQQAVAELIRLCGGFPLALGLIAARAVADAHLPLADTIDDLRALGLDALDCDDPTASLPTVLSWSLRHLTDQQRTAFSLLGIAPGPDTGLPAAASLIGLPERETHAVLRGLADASLIAHTPGGRYAMHDLVRAYAATTASELAEPTRQASMERVVDFYLHTAYVADCVLEPHAPPIRLEPPAPHVRPHPLPDDPAAMAWLGIEHPHLIAAQHTAAIQHRHHVVWQLAWALTTFHDRRGHRHDDLAVWSAALDAATHLPDLTMRIHAHRLLGRAYSRLERHEEAMGHLHRALALANNRQDPGLQAHVHRTLALVWGGRGNDRQALGHARHSLELLRNLDLPVWEAHLLNDVGWYAARLGEFDTARSHCNEALTLHQQHHHPIGEAEALSSLGYIDHHTSRHRRAIRRYERAVALYRALGNTYEVANTLSRLGHPHTALRRHDQARAVWQAALELYQEQGRDNDAARTQRQLDNLDSYDHDSERPSPATETAN